MSMQADNANGREKSAATLCPLFAVLLKQQFARVKIESNETAVIILSPEETTVIKDDGRITQ